MQVFYVKSSRKFQPAQTLIILRETTPKTYTRKQNNTANTLFSPYTCILQTNTLNLPLTTKQRNTGRETKQLFRARNKLLTNIGNVKKNGG